MRMVWWICGIQVTDRFPSNELRERLGIVYMISVLQPNRLRWYGHVLRKEDNDWVNKCVEYDEVEGSRPKRTWREVVEKDCRAHELNKKDAIDVSRWRKLMKDVWWPGWVWVGECFFWYRPTQGCPGQRAVKWLCVCVCVCVCVYWLQKAALLLPPTRSVENVDHTPDISCTLQ